MTARLAFDAAVARLERRLAGSREISRERGRRPKKCYAAARALAGTPWTVPVSAGVSAG